MTVSMIFGKYNTWMNIPASTQPYLPVPGKKYLNAWAATRPGMENTKAKNYLLILTTTLLNRAAEESHLRDL